ncbi:MAG: hypothetical protein WCP79_14545 [Bacillota bacterium]
MKNEFYPDTRTAEKHNQQNIAHERGKGLMMSDETVSGEYAVLVFDMPNACLDCRFFSMYEEMDKSTVVECKLCSFGFAETAFDYELHRCDQCPLIAATEINIKK